MEMTLHPGTSLGAYEIVEPIGAGAMGEVYRGRDTKPGRDVAIKVMGRRKPGLGADQLRPQLV